MAADAEPKRLTRDQCFAKAKECRELAKRSGALPSHAAIVCTENLILVD
jgi:hypothetical protein